MRCDTEVHAEISGRADGTVEDGDAIGEEAALERLCAVVGLGFAFERGQESFYDVKQVV